MRSDWADIRGRIAEEPAWYDVFGVPRYGPIPAKLMPFMGRIRCQSCDHEFRVCLVDEVYYALYGELLRLRLDPCPADPQAHHARFESGSLAEGVAMVPKPLPPDWHYGDPPAHHCTGDTMNSIPEYDWETDDGEAE